MRLRLTLAEAEALVRGEVPDDLRERVLERLNPVPDVIPGQVDLEDLLAEDEAQL